MAFSENLQYLRKQRQITQEQLAEKLEVSRQSVSKWESGGAYPETEKLLLLCDLFSCTMDALLRGDVKTGCEQAGQEYDQHMGRFSGMIALGVGLAILGVALLLFLHGIGVSDPLPVMVFLAVVVISVMLFVVGGLQHSLFLKRHPQTDKIYSQEETERFEKRFIILVAGSIALVLVGVIFQVGSGAIPLPRGWREEVYTAVFLLFTAVAAANLVHAGMTKAKYNTEGFNNEHGAAQDGHKPENSLAGMLSGVIMLTATIAFLLMGFIGNLWHIAWVVYPVGGILCGIVSTIADYKKQK